MHSLLGCESWLKGSWLDLLNFFPIVELIFYSQHIIAMWKRFYFLKLDSIFFCACMLTVNKIYFLFWFMVKTKQENPLCLLSVILFHSGFLWEPQRVVPTGRVDSGNHNNISEGSPYTPRHSGFSLTWLKQWWRWFPYCLNPVHPPMVSPSFHGGLVDMAGEHEEDSLPPTGKVTLGELLSTLLHLSRPSCTLF